MKNTVGVNYENKVEIFLSKALTQNMYFSRYQQLSTVLGVLS
jgi:hypothetical protein